MSSGNVVPLATSRYQEHDLISRSGLVPVRITRGAPRWKLRYQLGGIVKELAPTKDLFTQRHGADFEPRYLAQLDRCGLPAIAAAFEALSMQHDGRGLVLLCFEDVRELGESSCHRRMFARWWESATTQHVPEL